MYLVMIYLFTKKLVAFKKADWGFGLSPPSAFGEAFASMHNVHNEPWRSPDQGVQSCGQPLPAPFLNSSGHPTGR